MIQFACDLSDTNIEWFKVAIFTGDDEAAPPGLGFIQPGHYALKPPDHLVGLVHPARGID